MPHRVKVVWHALTYFFIYYQQGATIFHQHPVLIQSETEQFGIQNGFLRQHIWGLQLLKRSGFWPTQATLCMQITCILKSNKKQTSIEAAFGTKASSARFCLLKLKVSPGLLAVRGQERRKIRVYCAVLNLESTLNSYYHSNPCLTLNY